MFSQVSLGLELKELEGMGSQRIRVLGGVQLRFRCMEASFNVLSQFTSQKSVCKDKQQCSGYL